MRDSAPTRVTFVTEGGPEIGLGHMSRCVALARAALADGAEVSFVVTDDPEVRTLLAGLPVAVRSASWPIDVPLALEAVAALGSDVVVVDSYRASPPLLRSLRSVAQVVALDDLADCPLPAHIVVNGGAAAERLPYERTTSDTLFLLGPRYLPLDPCYGETPPAAGRPLDRVLVCLGGGRQVEALQTALGAVDRVFADCEVDIAAGPFVTESPELKSAALASPNRVVVHRGRFGLRDLMASAAIAVSGAGVTLHELCATATPTVAVVTADNQRPNCLAIADAGAALVAGDVGEPGLAAAIESALRRLAADPVLRVALAERGRALVDGQGAARVVSAITRPVASRT